MPALRLLQVVAASALSFGALAATSAPPFARPDLLITGEDVPRTFDPLRNDTGTLLPGTVTATTPLHGAASVDAATGWITYTPRPHFNGDDSFFYSVCDAAANCASAPVTVKVHFFGSFGVLTKHESNGVQGASFFERQLADGTGPRGERLSVFGEEAVMADGGLWAAYTNGGALTFQDLLDVTNHSNENLPAAASSPCFRPGSSTSLIVTLSTGEIWMATRPLDPTSHPMPERMEYDVDDGNGNTVKVPVLGEHAAFGPTAVIAIDNWQQIDVLAAPTGCTLSGPCLRAGISIFSPGGKPQVLVPDQGLTVPAWSFDGRLAFACPGVLNPGGMPTGAICALDPLGHAQTIKQLADPNKAAHLHWSPDGSKIAFSYGDFGPVFAMNADGTGFIGYNRTGPAHAPSWDPRALPAPAGPWTAPGRLVYRRIARDGSGIFSLRTVNPDGTADQELLAAAPSDGSFAPHPHWSPDGTRVAFTPADTLSSLRELDVVDSAGQNRQRLVGQVGNQVAWSPDGTRIAFTKQAFALGCANSCLLTVNGDGTNVTRVSTLIPESPTWTPDGRTIVFQTDDDGLVYFVPADGSAAAAPVQGLPSLTGLAYPALSPDGTTLAFTTSTPFNSTSVYLGDFSLAATPHVRNVRRLTFDDPASARHTAASPTWSPDGRAIAYNLFTYGTTAPQGFQQLWVVAADGTQDTRLSYDDTADTDEPNWGPPTPPAPAVASITPQEGSTMGGTVVTLSGGNFARPAPIDFLAAGEKRLALAPASPLAATVTICGASAMVTSTTPTTIQATTPPHLEGVCDVVVTNAGGSGTLASGFRYVVCATETTAPVVTAPPSASVTQTLCL